jgi:hypothetical protein
MSKRFPANPANPHRLCWGCDTYCPAGGMRCGNGSERTPHPVELFGEDWAQWGVPASGAEAAPERSEPAGRRQP